VSTLIYALKDPDSHAIRYVGKTITALTIRLHSHKYKARSGSSGTAVALWVRELLCSGKTPIIEALEAVGSERWQDAERRWITTLRNNGCDLLNMHPGGNGAHTRAALDPKWVAMLGKTADGDIAKLAGLCRETITYHRRCLGIPRIPKSMVRHRGFEKGIKPHNKAELPGVELLLGTMSDSELAGRYNVPTGLIKQRRQAARIPALNPKRQPKGLSHHASKLTPEIADAIRREYVPRVNGYAKLATLFGVHPSVIYSVVKGETWRNT
jgi:hypothetical protein